MSKSEHDSGEPGAELPATVLTQKSLPKLLDEIERGEHDYSVDYSIRVGKLITTRNKLVKALRETAGGLNDARATFMNLGIDNETPMGLQLRKASGRITTLLESLLREPTRRAADSVESGTEIHLVDQVTPKPISAMKEHSHE